MSRPVFWKCLIFTLFTALFLDRPLSAERVVDQRQIGIDLESGNIAIGGGVQQRLAQSVGDGASIGDVAEYMAVEHSTASRTVAPVVAAGLLTKTLAADDQRRCVLVLTDAGRQALAAVTDRRRELVADVVADWADGDVEALVTLLDRLAVDFERGVRA